MVFTIKYRVFLKIFPSSNSMPIGPRCLDEFWSATWKIWKGGRCRRIPLTSLTIYIAGGVCFCQMGTDQNLPKPCFGGWLSSCFMLFWCSPKQGFDPYRLQCISRAPDHCRSIPTIFKMRSTGDPLIWRLISAPLCRNHEDSAIPATL